MQQQENIANQNNLEQQNAYQLILPYITYWTPVATTTASAVLGAALLLQLRRRPHIDFPEIARDSAIGSIFFTVFFDGVRNAFKYVATLFCCARMDQPDYYYKLTPTLICSCFFGGAFFKNANIGEETAATLLGGIILRIIVSIVIMTRNLARVHPNDGVNPGDELEQGLGLRY